MSVAYPLACKGWMAGRIKQNETAVYVNAGHSS
jgi:hypothetical protein